VAQRETNVVARERAPPGYTCTGGEHARQLGAQRMPSATRGHLLHLHVNVHESTVGARQRHLGNGAARATRLHVEQHAVEQRREGDGVADHRLVHGRVDVERAASAVDRSSERRRRQGATCRVVVRRSDDVFRGRMSSAAAGAAAGRRAAAAADAATAADTAAAAGRRFENGCRMLVKLLDEHDVAGDPLHGLDQERLDQQRPPLLVLERVHKLLIAVHVHRAERAGRAGRGGGRKG
jgi:hypothetical protein